MTGFEIHCKSRESEASTASLPGFYTIEDAAADHDLGRIGTDWTRRLFDGDFYRVRDVPDGRPLVSLVFVQSRDANTGADDPGTLGGGATDKHLIYEGLSRVDADAVMAGAATARGERMVFSVWHPELVSLRHSLGHARHPAQIVVTDRGDLPIERGLMFNEPSLAVYVITRSPAAPGLRARLAGRPWVRVIDAGDPISFPAAMGELRRDGIRIISAVGGRRTATGLLTAGLVSELYLTTSAIDAGEPNTPFYEGPPLRLSRVVVKGGKHPEAGVTFQHFLLK
jgi:5-amino-6-(5-phosphoribosylamino)uracil reductase